jgi:hypothetical protein
MIVNSTSVCRTYSNILTAASVPRRLLWRLLSRAEASFDVLGEIPEILVNYHWLYALHLPLIVFSVS